jgi:ketosteroid isomerase-like protein
MSATNIDLIKQIYEHFNKRNYDAVVDSFDGNFEWIAADNSPLADRSPYRGREVVRDGVFERITAGFTHLEVAIDELIDAGEKIVVLGYYDGNFAVSGKRLYAQLAHVWTIANGKAVKFQQYVDTYAIAEASKVTAA